MEMQLKPRTCMGTECSTGACGAAVCPVPPSLRPHHYPHPGPGVVNLMSARSQVTRFRDMCSLRMVHAATTSFTQAGASHPAVPPLRRALHTSHPRVRLTHAQLGLRVSTNRSSLDQAEPADISSSSRLPSVLAPKLLKYWFPCLSLSWKVIISCAKFSWSPGGSIIEDTRLQEELFV